MIATWAVGAVLALIALSIQVVLTVPETAPAAVAGFVQRWHFVVGGVDNGSLAEGALAITELVLLAIPVVGAALGAARLAPRARSTLRRIRASDRSRQMTGGRP